MLLVKRRHLDHRCRRDTTRGGLEGDYSYMQTVNTLRQTSQKDEWITGDIACDVRAGSHLKQVGHVRTRIFASFGIAV